MTSIRLRDRTARQAVELLWPHIRGEWPALVVAVAATALTTLAGLAKPWPLALVVDWLVDDAGVIGWPLTGTDLGFLGAVAALVLGIALVDAAGGYMLEVHLGRTAENITDRLRGVAYEHLQHQSVRFHSRHQTGDLVTRLTSDVNAVGGLFSEIVGGMLSSGLLLVGMLAVSIWIDPLISLVVLAIAPLLGWLSLRFRVRVKHEARNARRREGLIAAHAAEALSAIRVVKAFGSEAHERERVHRHSSARREHGVRAVRLQGRFGTAVDVLGATASALVLVLGVVRVVTGAIQPGELVVLVAYARRVYRPLRGIARQANKAAKSMARAERLAELLAVDASLPEPPDARDGDRPVGDLRLDGVSFSYEPGRSALAGVDALVPAGTRLAIVGPSGAGKSTLLALIARFYDPTAGRVLVDGRDLRDWSTRWLRRHVAMVLQDTALFSGTVADNISYGTDAGPEAILAAARSAGAHGFITRLPEGYDTDLGPGGVALSGGQRQRIAIARALLRDPAILLLDEPTTGLDADSEAHVLNALRTLVAGRTSIIITHSVNLARTADAVIVLEGGRVIQRGGPDRLLAEPGPFRRLAVLQGVLAPSRPLRRPPLDPALPQLTRLLHAEAAGELIQRAVGAGGLVDQVTVRRVDYRPGTSAVVRYGVQIGGAQLTAVAAMDTGELPVPPGPAGQPGGSGQEPAGEHPVIYDADLDALLWFYPVDPWIPALPGVATALTRRLREAGLTVNGAAPTLLAYRPRRRATIAIGDHVVKLYRSHADFRTAWRALQVVSDAPDVRTAQARAGLGDLNATVQTRLVDAAPEAPTPREAGRLAAAIHACPSADGLPDHTPGDQLEVAARKAAVVTALVPHLRARAEALLARLAGSAPPPGSDTVLAHGSFSPDQVVAHEGALTVIDFDRACRAAAALDLADYLASLVRDDHGGRDQLLDARGELVKGYGANPADLDWYLATCLLRRAPHPFAKQRADWPVGVEAILHLAEQVAP